MVLVVTGQSESLECFMEEIVEEVMGHAPQDVGGKEDEGSTRGTVLN